MDTGRIMEDGHYGKQKTCSFTKQLLNVKSAPPATGSAKDTKWSATDTGALKDPQQRKGREPVLTVFCNTCDHRKVQGHLGGQKRKCLTLLGWDQKISEKSEL